jgi:hypothetical protein
MHSVNGVAAARCSPHRPSFTHPRHSYASGEDPKLSRPIAVDVPAFVSSVGAAGASLAEVTLDGMRDVYSTCKRPLSLFFHFSFTFLSLFCHFLSLFFHLLFVSSIFFFSALS